MKEKEELLNQERENLNQREAEVKKVIKQNVQLKQLNLRLINVGVKNQSQSHQNQIISSTPASSPTTNKTTPTIVEDIHSNSTNILAGSGQIQKIINLESNTNNNQPKNLFHTHFSNHNKNGNNGSNNNTTTKTNTFSKEYNANTILQSFLEKSLITKNPNWKRDYKLSRQTQFNLWLDLLKSEL